MAPNCRLVKVKNPVYKRKILCYTAKVCRQLCLPADDAGARSADHSDRDLATGEFIVIKEEITMISKEKKAAIIAEYGRTPGDTGSPEVQIAILTAALKGKPEGSPLQTGSADDGWSQTGPAGIP